MINSLICSRLKKTKGLLASLSFMETCPNCSTLLEKKFAYCPICGQSAHIHRFNLPHVFHEVFHALTHADKGLLHLIKNLTLRPGVTAREYILEGKRKTYFNPFTFLLLVLGLTVLANSYFKPYGTAPSPPARPQTQVQPNATVESMDQAVQQRKQAVFTMLN